MMAHDVIFVSMENWDDVWRRNQFLCDGLARRHPHLQILFVGLPRNASRAVASGRFGELMGGADEGATGLPNVTFTRPLKLFPDSMAAGRRTNRWLFRRHIRAAAERLGLRWPVLWLNPHYAVHMVGQMGESAVVYDVTDDWTTLAQPPAVARRTVDEDAELCRRADAVIVCSQRLFELKRPLARELHLIPNGVNVAHYARVSDGGRDGLPAAARAWRRPVYGYAGTVHPDRVDVDLLAAVARLVPKATFALVGPNLLSAADVARLASAGNVVLAGPVKYREVADYMRAFDVCITPHRVTPFTESLNPIKLWEYLAAGKPIVSTPVAGFRDYPHLVALAYGAEAFAAALRAAADETTELAASRRREALAHGWPARLDAVESVLERCAARRRHMPPPADGRVAVVADVSGVTGGGPAVG